MQKIKANKSQKCKQRSDFLHLVFFWGMGITGISLCLIVRVLHQAPDATDIANAIYSGIYNIGIGGGALLGQQVMQHYGLIYLGQTGVYLIVIAILMLLSVTWFWRRSSTPPIPEKPQ